MAAYTMTWKSNAIKRLKLSIHSRVKAGWSASVGSGFIAEDIKEAGFDRDSESKAFYVQLIGNDGCMLINCELKDLNLREQQELLLWLENELLQWNDAKERYVKMRMVEA